MILVHRAAPAVSILAFTFVLASSTRPAHAVTWQWDSAPNFQFQMWIDDGQDVVYGFYIIFNESAGDTRVLTERPRIQDWARTMGFGIIGTRFDAEDGSDIEQSDTVIEALENFAMLSNHPEVANAPLLCDGISLGGHNSIKFATIYPERTIGYLGGAAAYNPPGVGDPDFARVPGLFYHGELDSDIDDATERLNEFLPLRADDVEVAFFIQWGYGHEYGLSDRMGWKILGDMVYLRYPVDASPVDGPVPLIDIPLEDGWVADYQTWDGDITEIAPYDEAESPRNDFWLPSRDAAYVYRAHASQNRPLSIVSPPGPENYDSVDPGDTVDIEVDVGGLGGVESVEVFDGSEPIAEINSPPYTATWTAEGIGMHAIVAVANLTDGTQRTGYVSPLMVLGSQRPGGGTIGGGGGGGDDDGSDGGGDDGDDGSDGGGAGGDNGDGSGGCGCRAGTRDAGGTAGALLLVLATAFAAGRRVRTTVSNRSANKNPRSASERIYRPRVRPSGGLCPTISPGAAVSLTRQGQEPEARAE